MAKVDAQLKSRVRQGETPPEAQAALIALDPHTGAIKAVVGGRHYAESQLNHALALRPPGSIFKPLVYAAALQAGQDRTQKVTFTPNTTVLDQPTTFHYEGGQTYQPGNFHDRYHGLVSLRQALAWSMNIPAVRVAELVGYDRVVQLARRRA